MMNAKVEQGRTVRAVAVIAAVCLALTVVLATACSGQQGASSGASGSASAASSVQASAVDTTEWKTLGDAFAAQTDSMASGWNSEYYVTVFKSGDSIIRVVAKIDEETNAKLNAVDWTRDDVSKQVEEAASTAEIVSAQDLTSEVLSQDVLDTYVGKTGQDLVDEGWAFESYFMYGGEQTGAVFAHEHLAYWVTFDVSITEDEYDDGGASTMEATIVEMSLEGPANSAVDPTNPE